MKVQICSRCGLIMQCDKYGFQYCSGCGGTDLSDDLLLTTADLISFLDGIKKLKEQIDILNDILKKNKKEIE